MANLLRGLSKHDPPKLRQFTVIYTKFDDPAQIPAAVRARTRLGCIQRFHEMFKHGEKVEFILEGEWKCA